MYPLIIAALDPHLSVILDHAIAALGVLLGIVVPVLGAYLVMLIKKKTGLELSAQAEAKLQGALLDGVSFAEEWARKKVVSGEEKPASAQKLDAALKFVKDELERLGLTDIAEEKLRDMLEAKLGLTR